MKIFRTEKCCQHGLFCDNQKASFICSFDRSAIFHHHAEEKLIGTGRQKFEDFLQMKSPIVRSRRKYKNCPTVNAIFAHMVQV